MISQLDTGKCPVCATPLRTPPGTRGGTADLAYYDCRHCGTFGLTRTAEAQLRSLLSGLANRDQKTSAFAHTLRKLQAGPESPMLTSQLAERIIETADLPTVQEQADNLIRLLGTLLPPGESTDINFLEHGAIVGAQSLPAFAFLARSLIDSGLLKGSLAGGGHASVTLSFQGWQRFEELRLGAPSGRKAFMAMPYGDDRLDRIVNGFFRPAVADTGFELRRLDDEPRAGLIDDRLRLEIQGARFVIVDLTNDNLGAYWEAGYAEGLQKPVIYTCEKTFFEKQRTHFDTNHHLHILWEEPELMEAVAQLKITIRATVPEAKRDDV